MERGTEGPVDAVGLAVKRLAQIDGAVQVAVVAVPSGQVLGAEPAPAADEPGPPVAGVAADLLRAVAVLATAYPDDGPLEDVVVTTGERHHVVRELGFGPEGVLLVVTLDRGRTNLALARLRLREAEVELGAG